jgi:predicted MFS family arabinose efflux permease
MKNQSLFLFSAIFILIPVSAARPMSSLFAEHLGASLVGIGLITACYSVIPLFIAIYTGRFIDKFGEKTPLLAGSMGVALSSILPYLYPDIKTLYLSLLLLGGSQFLGVVSIQNGVARSVPAEERDKAISTFSLFASIGLMLGPLIGGYLTQHLGFQKSYLILSFVSIISLFLTFFVYQKKGDYQNKKTNSLRTKELLSIDGLKRIIFVSMLNLAALDLFYVYYPIYANSIGFTPSQIGIILMFQSLSSVMVRFLLPRLTIKFGRIQILSSFMLLGASAYGILPFFSQYALVIVVAILVGAGLGIAQPLTIILSYTFAPKNHTGEVLGMRLAGNRLSQIISPVVFAGISGLTGLGAIFIIEAILLVMGAVFSVKLNKKEESISVPDNKVRGKEGKR